ncbi:DNA-directed DNA polymerase [Pirellula staleyi DSM 6068]|uniref:DNA-directed DNA polymerase n=1 Tax=Pirellula staleyi (strain ATCC 27377 / DSM 6068 / ICPB 4128) TaxID=530564 RepID=D2R017_PIRSD|nr:nucleotidyltransferase [Pirellula staleyi]ADB18382.1 DNA-directed DNA polymerase [Pirellula staleyi DSM 6068]
MLIAHLDADCFYVSAERVRDRFLADKPVGVLGNQGACVIAKSYEMKKAGVKTGEPIWEALTKCPDGIYVKRDFRWYEVLSRAMLDVVREFSPQVEYYSIDEFFLSVDQSPASFAHELQQAILDRVGVPVTIGVARTRTLAKLVSDLAKPFGALALIGREAEEQLLASRPASDVTGIAERSAAKLRSFGIVTCLDLARADPTQVRSVLTVTGERLCYELRGEKCVPIQSKRPLHKIVSRGGSIGAPSSDPAIQWAWCVRNLERLIEALESYGLCAGKLAFAVDYKHGPTCAADTRLTFPTTRFDMLVEAARHLWKQVQMQGLLLYRMHYFASELQYPGPRQLGLFEPTIRDGLHALKSEINSRHGRFALRSAATLPLTEIYADESHSYEICDIAGKTCF